MSSVKETFDDINQLDCFGYLPTSSSIKPAHIANGWFRRLLGKYYDPVLLNQTVIHWTQNGEINPSDRLLADNPSVFEPFRPVAKRASGGLVEDLLARHAVESVELELRILVLGADPGVADDHQTYLVCTLITLRLLSPRGNDFLPKRGCR